MTTQQFAEQVKAVLGENLASFAVYGSTATGEATRLYSDVNTLIVARELSMDTLKRLAEPVERWTRKGQPAPTLFTVERLRRSADVFPIEIHDMQERHRVLAGEDLLGGLTIDDRHLRFQVEHELKGGLMKLRSAYLTTGAKPKRVAELLGRSVGTFQLLFRAALRLYAPGEACSKLDAPQRLSAFIDFDAEAFAGAQALKEGAQNYKSMDCEALFARMLAGVAAVADAVDGLDASGK